MQPGTITLMGEERLIRKFGELAPELQRKGLRKGVTKAGRMTAKAAKAEAEKSKETGALKAALGSRVFTFRDKTGVGAVVGVRKGTKRRSSRVGVVRGKRGGFRKARKGETAAAYRNPEKYLHLVILGTRHSKANNFLLRAAVKTRGQSIRIITHEARSQLQRETAAKA